MLHISSSIPCLLNWNFSSEDNPGKIKQKIIKPCKSITSTHCCSQPKISDSQLEGRLGEKQNSDLLYSYFLGWCFEIHCLRPEGRICIWT